MRKHGKCEPVRATVAVLLLSLSIPLLFCACAGKRQAADPTSGENMSDTKISGPDISGTDTSDTDTSGSDISGPDVSVLPGNNVTNPDYGKKYRSYLPNGMSLGLSFTGTEDYIYATVYERTEEKAGSGKKRVVLKMYAVDLKSGIQLPLCGKADCSHTGGRCNAYLFEGKKKGEYAQVYHMQPYDNVIIIFYLTGDDESKATYRLAGISPDGSTRYDYIDFEMLKPEGIEAGSSYSRNIHDIRVEDGYLYFLERWGFDDDPVSGFSGRYTHRLWRMSLSDGERKCLYEKNISHDAERPSARSFTSMTYDISDGDIYVMFGTYLREDPEGKNDVEEVTFIDGKTLEKSMPEGERKYGCFMTDGGYPVGRYVKRNNSGKFLITNREYHPGDNTMYTKYVLYDRDTGKEIIKTDTELWNVHVMYGYEQVDFIDEEHVYLHDDSGGTYIYDLDFNPVTYIYPGMCASFGEYFSGAVLNTIVRMEDVKAGKEVYYSLGSFDDQNDNWIYTPNTFVYSKPLTAKKEERNP